MFDLDQFIAECGDARSNPMAVREVVARAVAEPEALIKALGEPRRAGVQGLYRSPELTVLNLVWGPGMSVMPHNHEMWAVIGIYSGREDNIFWRRLPDGKGRIEAAGAKSLCDRDVQPLGRDIIHSVLNPIRRLTGAIHVYGGDFIAAQRSEWDPEALIEQPYNLEKTLALFEESNRLLSTPSTK
jgi:predicted metal-dependent enzyme (double-stranded beta helix superfamily)